VGEVSDGFAYSFKGIDPDEAFPIMWLGGIGVLAS
jgi:hypothetical protein